ncbi:general odorant-binding protein 19d-like isoform X1 [Vanessa atalanta]|uniref:general odorant-binding protein 19d-like isoform X1 n=2 Tax=Vanessa atalanta TaxID=42275 RepID=UPI001FCD1523|nr:general odorant-binding protein 19d-like isoform X1 [Vanessa atalanta]
MFRSVLLISFLLINYMVFDIAAMTADQKAMIHKHFEEIGIECIKDHVITKDDITNLKAKKIPTGDNAPCFLACMLRKLGVLDDAGLLQKETALDLAKKVFNDNEELKLIENYLHSCSHINSEPVGDGDKGCERSMLAYKCMIENASQFGIEI